MSYICRCKHGIYLDACRECYPLPKGNEMNKRDADFEFWWRGQDDEFRDDIRKKDAKRIWNAGFKAGGARPWWSITQEQWAILSKNLGGKK